MFATAYRHEARLLMTEGYVSTWVEEVADLVSRPARGEFERHYGLPAPVTEEIPLRKYVLMISLQRHGLSSTCDTLAACASVSPHQLTYGSTQEHMIYVKSMSDCVNVSPP